MKMKRNRFAALLIAAAMLISLCACGAPSNTDSAPAPQNSELPSNSGAPAGDGTRIITDGLGRQVEIPAVVERIVPLGNTPRMISYLGLADRVVGIGDCEIAESPLMAYAYPHREQWASLPVCGTDAMGETAFYPEEMITVNPDVILCSYTEDVVNNIQSQTGLPVVAVPQGSLFDEDYDQALRILGEVCGVSERAEAISAYIKECLSDLESRTKDIPEEDKPLVLGAAATFKGGHSIDCVYTQYPVFQIVYAKDAAIDAAVQSNSNGVMVDKEQILEWDPDIIFLDAGNVALVNADYAESPDYFAQLKAVREGRLYQWPNSTWHWTNVEIPLVSAYYTGQLLYPDAFVDMDFEEKADEIFTFFLGVSGYLKVLEEAGVGYGQVTLGE